MTMLTAVSAASTMNVCVAQDDDVTDDDESSEIQPSDDEDEDDDDAEPTSTTLYKPSEYTPPTGRTVPSGPLGDIVGPLQGPRLDRYGLLVPERWVPPSVINKVGLSNQGTASNLPSPLGLTSSLHILEVKNALPYKRTRSASSLRPPAKRQKIGLQSSAQQGGSDGIAIDRSRPCPSVTRSRHEWGKTFANESNAGKHGRVSDARPSQPLTCPTTHRTAFLKTVLAPTHHNGMEFQHIRRHPSPISLPDDSRCEHLVDAALKSQVSFTLY
jgi:hypothetical protein